MPLLTALWKRSLSPENPRNKNTTPKNPNMSNTHCRVEVQVTPKMAPSTVAGFTRRGPRSDVGRKLGHSLWTPLQWCLTAAKCLQPICKGGNSGPVSIQAHLSASLLVCVFRLIAVWSSSSDIKLSASVFGTHHRFVRRGSQ